MPSNFHHPVILHARSAGATLYRMWNNLDRLNHVHFAYAMLAAFLLHLLVYTIWLFVPKTPVVDIPVRVLSIKLGDIENTEIDSQPAPAKASNAASVEKIISKVVEDIKADKMPDDVVVKAEDKKKKKQKAKPKPKKPLYTKPFDYRKEGVAEAAPVMSVVEKQYVRETEKPAEPQAGHALGSPTLDKAQIVSRYEQLISAWIDKFKPDNIGSFGQPARVTAIVRIRIDRRGNIRWMEMDKGTEFVALDRAALDTVRRANPVPAVPAEYPSGEQIEFKVPIVFIK
ncbi:MAG: energy transducer TonB family protein [Rickettsiales bacterium]